MSFLYRTLQRTSLSFYHYNDVVAFISAQQKRLDIKHADDCLSQRAPLSVIATRTIDEQHTFGPKVRAQHQQSGSARKRRRRRLNFETAAAFSLGRTACIEEDGIESQTRMHPQEMQSVCMQDVHMAPTQAKILSCERQHSIIALDAGHCALGVPLCKVHRQYAAADPDEA